MSKLPIQLKMATAATTVGEETVAIAVKVTQEKLWFPAFPLPIAVL